MSGKLVVDNESGSTWTCQFNPFNPAVTLVSFGWIYEPLEYVDILKTGSVTPWLADHVGVVERLQDADVHDPKWRDVERRQAVQRGRRCLHLQRDEERQGDRPQCDLEGRRRSTDRCDPEGKPGRVHLRHAVRAVLLLVADQTPIVPKHIWAKLNQSKLHSYSDTHPVGTGPYLMSNCAPQNIKYLNNPHYWQSSAGHPVPAVKEVDYPSFLSNTSANLFLAQGQAQWGGQYIPSIQSFYISKDPSNRHYWFAPVLNVSLFPNLTNSLLSQLPVRQAISTAINRDTVSRLGESGYQAPANQSGVILPTYQAGRIPH